MENMDEKSKEAFKEALNGAYNGLTEKEETLISKAADIANSVTNAFKKVFDICPYLPEKYL